MPRTVAAEDGVSVDGDIILFNGAGDGDIYAVVGPINLLYFARG